MKNLLRPIIAMLSAVVLFLFYQWDVNRVERAKLHAIQNQQVLFADTGVVSGITFVNSKGTFHAERAANSPDAWTLTSPQKAPASASVMNAYVENLRGAKRQAEFPMDDAKKYGFDAPHQKVTVAMKDEKGVTKEKTLLFGAQPVPYGPVYVMIDGDKTAFTVSEWFDRQSAKDFDGMRDRTVVRDDIGKTIKFRIDSKGTPWAIQRPSATGNEWYLERPGIKSLPADRSLVDRQLVALTQGKFVEIEDHLTSSTAELGLDSPVLTLYADDKELVRIGNPVPGKEQLFAKNDEGTIGIVTGAQFVNFLRPPVEWGTKRFFWIKADGIQQIETSSGNSAMNLLHDKSKWIFADMPDVPLNTARLDQFVTELLTLSAQQLVKEKVEKSEWEKYGIIDGGFRAAITGFDGVVQSLRFGITNSKEGFTYVLRENDDSLWKVDVKNQNGIFKFRSDLMDRRIFPGLAAKVSRMEIQVGDVVVHIDKTSGGWRSVLPDQPAAILPNAGVQDFLGAVEELEAQSEMLGTKKSKVQSTFRFYEEKATDPFTTIDVLGANEQSAFIVVSGKVIELTYPQFKPVDDLMAKIMLDTKAAVEKSK